MLYTSQEIKPPFSYTTLAQVQEDTMGHQGGLEASRGHNQIPRKSWREGQTRDMASWVPYSPMWLSLSGRMGRGGQKKDPGPSSPRQGNSASLGVTSHASPSLRGPLPLVQRSQGSITKDPVTGPAHRGAGHLILELRG